MRRTRPDFGLGWRVRVGMAPRSNTTLSEVFAGIRRHRPDMPLMLFVAVLILLGLIVIYAISPALIARINLSGSELDQNHFLYRQLIYIGIGVAAFVMGAIVPIDFWRKHANKVLWIGVVLALMPFVLQATPLALCVNGACRWIDLGPISFQPVEIMKFGLLVFLANFLAVRVVQGRLNDVRYSLVPLGILLGVIAVIVIGLQKDLGTGLTIFAIVLTMLFVAGLRAKHFGLAIAAAALVGGLFIVIAPHRIERVLTFVNHSSAQDDGMAYHVNQALIAVGSGGLTGKGLGQSVQAFGYLPEAANDSIFAILAEKFGFLGTLVVLAVFSALFLRLLFIMDRTTSLMPKLLVAGTFGWVFSHSIINIGAMLGIFPLTGITLPFVSFGGTSLLCILAALGLVFNISRYTSHSTSVRGDSYDNRRRGRGVGGTRYAGFSRSA